MGRRRSSRRPCGSACRCRMRSKAARAALSRHRLIGRVENVALARINLARDAGNEHVAALKSHRAFERRDQVAVVVLVRERVALVRSEEHTSELQSLMRISYAVFCMKKKKYNYIIT